MTHEVLTLFPDHAVATCIPPWRPVAAVQDWPDNADLIADVARLGYIKSTITYAEALGLDVVDEFIHRREMGPMPDHSQTTEHARRNASTLLVLRRRRPRRDVLRSGPVA